MRESIDVVESHRWAKAIDLLLARLPEDSQPQQRVALRAGLAADARQAAGLLGHFRGDEITAVCWLQRQPGRVDSLWHPAFSGRTEPAIAEALIERAIETSRAFGAVMIQSLLATDVGDEPQLLRQAGFRHIADLLYLVSLAESFPGSRPHSALSFSPLLENSTSSFERLIERTYESTRDCPALDGVRAIGDVLEGYRAVGHFRPDFWFIVRLDNEDVGCALVADHSPEFVWELVYMGIVPEARGRRLGLEITRYVQWLAARDQVKRLVLAVDAANDPAIAMYAAAGFVSWDRRSVFVRVL